MDRSRILVFLVALILVSISMKATLVKGHGSNNGNGNGNGINDRSASTQYRVLAPKRRTNQERVFCEARGRCHYATLECPRECPERNPKNNRKQKGCFIDCSSKCEATCKFRKAKCNGYGSMCYESYDPRFGNGNNNGNGKGYVPNKKVNDSPASTQYKVLAPKRGTNQERVFCEARGQCHYATLECPRECPERNPKNNRKQKGCFIDCSSKCEATCKFRKAKCNGYGSMCYESYDPKFGNGNNGNGNGNGNGNNNGNGKGYVPNKKVNDSPASTQYKVLAPKRGTNQERVFCEARGQCHYATLVCPPECPERNPKKNRKQKGCFIDCSSKCETTCKFRKAKCNGYGSMCYDPRFVGGDGVMFYFHGCKGGDFALVSDNELHINGHFIGTRPEGRTRDYTWVQALSVMFDSHTLILAAKRVSKWEDNVDALYVQWNGKEIEVPTDGEAEWRTNEGEREVIVERTDDTNSVRVSISGLVEMDISIKPVEAEENRAHNYQLPSDDAFAHLETQFRFSNLSDLVEGVLGKTYRPNYVSSVKVGVPMPMMGGEEKYQTPSLLSPLCKACRFTGITTSSQMGLANEMVAQ